METFIVPAAHIYPYSRYFVCDHGFIVTSKYRDKLLRDLLEDNCPEDISVNRRFYLFNNVRLRGKPCCKIGFWYGVSSPARVLTIPTHMVDRIARSSWSGVRYYEDTLLGVHFNPNVT